MTKKIIIHISVSSGSPTKGVADGIRIVNLQDPAAIADFDYIVNNQNITLTQRSKVKA